MVLRFQVTEREDGWQLRDFLRSRNVSASLLTLLKRTDGIRVDGTPACVNERISAGSLISLTLPQEHSDTIRPQALPFGIVYESDHAAVLDKPAGMTVHPTLGYHTGTLANAWMGELSRRGECGVFRPVNRIDRNTSGLVLCAKNMWSAAILPQNVKKLYLAIVQGEMSVGEGVIDAPIARSRDSIIRRCVDPQGKTSRTEYRVLSASGGCSLVACIPVTGRTHQIRVHFAWMGHPLVGDDLYGGSTNGMSRHALHCARLTFLEPETGKSVCARSALPEDMKSFLKECDICFSDFSHL